MEIIVTCQDGAIRHTPFTTMADASDWAEWGHCCLADHRFTRIPTDS